MKLHNNMSKNVSEDQTIQLLFDRLLWLRNHYDIATAPEMRLKERVLADVDAVINKLIDHAVK